ncbi:MAG: transglutaminase-like domain-containing protein, partial [Betaproteobacteria bacterium]
VLLLRAQGIPARFVKGLSVGPQDDYGGGLFVVREADAHAWAEAYLEGRGWVEIDPTPPDAFAAAHPAPATLDRLLERLRAALSEAWARLTGPGVVSFLRWLADGLASLGRAAVERPLLLAGLALVLASRRIARWLRSQYGRRRSLRQARAASGVPRELREAIADLERLWRRLGRPRPPSRGLREHALAQQLPAAVSSAPAAEAGRNLIELYYRARFGGQPPAPEEVGRLRAALQAGANSRTGARSEA